MVHHHLVSALCCLAACQPLPAPPAQSRRLLWLCMGWIAENLSLIVCWGAHPERSAESATQDDDLIWLEP